MSKIYYFTQSTKIFMVTMINAMNETFDANNASERHVQVCTRRQGRQVRTRSTEHEAQCATSNSAGASR